MARAGRAASSKLPDVIFVDTVGFVRKLPTSLVASFRSTLAEIRDADLVLHVVDASSPRADEEARIAAQTFEELGVSALVKAAEACGAILQKEDGLDEILDLIGSTLVPRLHETAYALAVEVAAVDLHVEQEELRFLQMLRDRLDLNKLTVAAIEHSARVRYRTM